MNVQEHTAYKKARLLSKIVWKTSRTWDRNTFAILGNQLIRASDSISANLAEGWSRYSKKDKINFFIIARGSVAEVADWMEKAFERNLVSLLEYNSAQEILTSLPKEINGLIKGTKLNLKK